MTMRRYIALMVMSLMLLCNAEAAYKWSSTYQAYVNKYKDIAIEQMLSYRIPASITLAQGLLESGAGTSRLATQGNNHFGIKCHTWTGKRMYMDDDKKGDCFRVYDNARQSFVDHSDFLTKTRYQSLFKLSIRDYKGWARGLKSCGYATNPKYADNLIEIIELYGLYKYDTATSYDSSNIDGFTSSSSGSSLKSIFSVFKKSKSTKTKKSKKTKAAKTKKTKTTKAKKTTTPVYDHKVYMYNNNYYVIAYQGETLRSISKNTGVSRRKLARYNELDVNDVLSAGDVIYLEKKQKNAEVKYKGYLHTVKAGESLYTIAQMYGIQLKSLYKKNGLSPDYELHIGDRLRVY